MKKIIVVLITFSCLQLQCDCFAQKQGQALIDSLVGEIPKAKDDTNKVDLLAEISFDYSTINPDEGIRYGNEALTLAEKLNWEKGIARAHNRIGVNYGIGKSDLVNALDHYLKALKLYEKLGEKKWIAGVLNNIGIVHFNNAEYDQALQYYSRAMKINTELDNKPWLANNLSNIGITNIKMNDFKNGEDYINRAIKLKEELGDGYGMAINLYQLGALYGHESHYDKSFEALFSALSIYRSGNVTDLMGQTYQKLAESYFNMAKDTSGEGMAQLKKICGDKRAALRSAHLYADSCLMMSSQTGNLASLQDGYMILSEVQSLQGDKDEALKNYKTYILYKDSMVNIEKDKKLTQKTMQYEFDKKEAAAKAEQEKKDIRQKNIRNSISAGLGGALIFLVVVYRQRNRISKEKKRSEELLLNILPEEVAEELKQKGEAEAKLIDSATVLFTDFKGFTQFSEKLSPKELVAEIDLCFRAFDNIMQKHGVEKIKTIGDSYMCAGGLPVPNNTHATDVVSAALDIQKFMQQHKAEREAAGKLFFEIRIGIHTGPVVAGIVGVKKYSYDIWGDTVNTASRMESSGEASKVNISGTTYELVKDKFNCIHRGKIEAKNKGEIDMYFVK